MLSTIAKPFGMLLMFLYTLVGNYGIAIFLVAVVIKIIMLPFQMKSKRGTIQQARLQPMISEIQRKHSGNQSKISEETMKLYKEEGVNPASGCIWSFLPLPIMIALFQVIRQPLTMMMGVTAQELTLITAQLESMDFVSALSPQFIQIAQSIFITENFSFFQHLSANLRPIDFTFFAGVNFGLAPQWDYLWSADINLYGTLVAGLILFLIPFMSAGTQFLSMEINRRITPTAQNDQAAQMNGMLKFMPLMSVYIGFVTPAALGFYWVVSTALQIVQDVWLTKVYSKTIIAEEAEKAEARKKREAELEAKRLETERKKAEGIAPQNPNTSKRKMQSTEKQQQIERAAEWQRKNSPTKIAPEEPSRVGARRYARGRAYDPNRYGDPIDDYDDSEDYDDTDSFDDSSVEFIDETESETDE